MQSAVNMQLQTEKVAGWVRVTLILCVFGILREIRPSEPYVSEFILGEWRNITETELNQQIYPVGTYSYLAQLVLVFLVTDYLRFKPVIVSSGICGIIVYAILLWTTSLEWLQVTQFFYGLYMATEVAYYTYIFAKVDADKYARVSSYTRMAMLSGRFLSGVMAQLLTTFNIMDYRQLIYITFTAEIVGTFWALCLPPVKFSVYFHREDSAQSPEQTEVASTVQKSESAYVKKTGCCDQSAVAFSLLWRHFRSAFARSEVRRWSALYAVSMCLFVQAQSYVQILWLDLQSAVPQDERLSYNGLIEACLTLGGGGAAYVASCTRPSHAPAWLAALQAAAMLLAALPGSVVLSYIGYVLTGISYHYVITVASTKIARQLSDESCFGLVFGLNTLIGTLLQSLFILVVVSGTGLGLPIRQQFYAISGCYAVLTIAWSCTLFFKTDKNPANSVPVP